jgi:hypothetical protein
MTPMLAGVPKYLISSHRKSSFYIAEFSTLLYGKDQITWHHVEMIVTVVAIKHHQGPFWTRPWLYVRPYGPYSYSFTIYIS